MQVWLYPEKKREELGAERWDVEWSEVSPEALKRNKETESIDFDMDVDLLTFHRYFKTEEAAKRAALDTLKRRSDWLSFGSVIINRQTVQWFVKEDNVAHWEDVGEPEYVD